MSSSPTSLSSSELEAPLSTPFDALGQLKCPVTVTLGTGHISVRQCLALQQHSIIRLAESAGDDLQVSVNGVPIARGEVAFVDAQTAIRVTALAPPLPGKRAGQ